MFLLTPRRTKDKCQLYDFLSPNPGICYFSFLIFLLSNPSRSFLHFIPLYISSFQFIQISLYVFILDIQQLHNLPNLSALRKLLEENVNPVVSSINIL